MDNDALRREIAAEVRAEFEAQVRELKRLNNEAEKQLEEGSERWRAERRRLNAEIDKLDQELSRDRSSRASRIDADALRQTLEKEIRQTLEEQVRGAAAGWEEERERLKAQVSRLEASLVESITQTNNPLRATHGMRDNMELKLTEANKARADAESQLMRLKALWDEDKAKMREELMRLRQSVRPGALETAASERLDAWRVPAAGIRTGEFGSQSGPAGEYAATHPAAAATGQTESAMLPGVGSMEFLFASPAHKTSIEAEAQRVEALVRVIEILLEDEDTPASTIARKNAEKLENEAYLRGLRFGLTRSKAVGA